MLLKPPLATRLRRDYGGFTIVELLVAMVIALIATLAITHLVLNSEAQRRATTSGSDAQANGALGVGQLRRALMSAGYGYTQTPAVIGCPMVALYEGVPVPGFPSVLAPVFISDGGVAGEPDSIRVLGSAKSSYGVPARLVAPYAPPQTELRVATTTGIQAPSVSQFGDLMLVAKEAGHPCEVFHASEVVGATHIRRADDATGWNSPGHPSQSYADGDYVINLGRFGDITFGIHRNSLVATSFKLSSTGRPSYEGPTEIQPNVVNLQALYGKDANGDGAIDLWDARTPTGNAEWLQIAALRVAVVARSAQFEKETVTSSNIMWDVGTTAPVEGWIDCGLSKCLPIKLDQLPDWDHYRYKIFDSIIPLRNVLWSAP